MIVTRNWLGEFVNLDGISDEVLSATLNGIGLEVGQMQRVTAPNKIVVGQVISCQKHPDATKLNVCQVDVGTHTRQIVCGAANVAQDQYVAVAMIGAQLPNGITIKHAKLRGVESEGMICSASELGLSDINDGIMVLDDSIGELLVGKELVEYSVFDDTVFDIELTPNRGDCLSVYGVGRDLSVALERDLNRFEFKPNKEKIKLGISRSSTLEVHGSIHADLAYALMSVDDITTPILVALRLAIIEKLTGNSISDLITYARHATGVILRSYDAQAFEVQEGKYTISLSEDSSGLARVEGNGKLCSIVGVNQEDCAISKDARPLFFVEASYVNPHALVERFAATKFKKDALYFNTSRGSNPDLLFGLELILHLFSKYSNCGCHEGYLHHYASRSKDVVKVSIKEINKIIGYDIEKSKIATILQRLGFELGYVDDDILAVTIPLFRSDIKNIQDITEEIVRMVGIDIVTSKPLRFVEQYHENRELVLYRAKRAMKQRAVGNGFFEAISYVFTEKKLLQEYDFETLDDKLELLNPIVGELNTLRTTLSVNLLLAARRNASYGKKAIGLFEMGAVFDTKRVQKEHIGFLWSGQVSSEGVSSQGKPSFISLDLFLKKLEGSIGRFYIAPCSYTHKFIHPYHSADIVIDGKSCGYITKLHPTAREAFGLEDTYIAEIDSEAIFPRHIEASPISNFQGVYKDLSVVIDSTIPYHEISEVLRGLDVDILKSIYPVDIYTDSTLKEKHSLTLRCFMQSMDKTLEDNDIEGAMAVILETLKEKFGVYLR